MKIAILDDYQQVAKQLADWGSLPAGTQVDSFAENIADRAELVRRLTPYDVIVAMRERTRFPADVINALPNLRLVVSTGGRNPSIDAEACAARNIALCSAHGAASGQSSTAEVAWALVLALTKRIPQAQQALRAGGWQESVVTESLAGKTLGVLGLGRLGKHVARYGQAFGMKVIAWSPHLTDERATEVSVRRVSKEALFAESDVVSLHLVSNAATKGIVGAAEIQAMKPSAYIINTSRGPLIDEQALLKALQERRIAGAGLDVFWTEPLPKDHPVRRLDNVVLTPHLGYVVDENLEKFYDNALKNIRNFIAGLPLTPMGR
ncbi:MAG TPA: D-2-hydroxyacid dehydrogenase family protein [Burkholderiales bacterium]|nr:D-2-hydroxyacid dehydrogenase family protein [Burkholderiales bacterium]